jgi:hypothetical protein
MLSQTAFAAPIRVAVESASGSSATSTELAAQLNDDTWYDFDATVVVASDIDTAAELASYDVVIIGDSGFNQADWTAAMANALATWTSAGNGGVLSVGWVDWVTGPGASVLTTIDTVQPIDSYSFHYAFGNNSDVAVSSTSHPVTDGLAGTTISGSANHVEASPSACDATNCQVLGTITGGTAYSGGTNAIVVGEYGSGRTVFLGQLFMAASSYSNTGLRSGDSDRLLEQAVAWIADAIFVDSDGDGIEDSADNCPNVSNTLQADADGDGVGDACDECDGDDAYGDIDGDLECADIDCDDTDPLVNTSATEICDYIDNNCDGNIDEDSASGVLPWYADSDSDGYGNVVATDSYCSQPPGYVAASSDCDDSDGAVNPSATEICDYIDNNCDGNIDEDSASGVSTWYADSDSDGYGDVVATDIDCWQPTGYVADSTDCDDTDGSVNPAATEICDYIDNNCDGNVDEDSASGASTWYADSDSDGYGNAATADIDCWQPTGYVSDSTDCDDTNGSVNPAATEICDYIDNNCDGNVDEDSASGVSTWFADSDSDGYGNAAAADIDCWQPTGYVSDSTDCDDTVSTINPGATEYCNGVDDNCDGSIDEDTAADVVTWYADSDSDGYGNVSVTDIDCSQPSGYVGDDTDCDDTVATTNPGATEYCNGVDDNCDGDIDEDTADDAVTWYADSDADGYGDAAVTDIECTQPSGFVADDTDCDDAVFTTNPGVSEYCNGVDDDCDLDVDEDSAVDVVTWYADADTDGYGDAAVSDIDCDQPSGMVDDDSDCDDTDDTIYPGAPEVEYDGIDQDCDTLDLCDVDEDTYSAVECGGDDCDDADDGVHVDAAETWYDGIDQNCDELSDYDADYDGYDSETWGGEDCDDADADVYPGAPDEYYDGVVHDCDEADEYDADGDGYDSADFGGEDCDDANSEIRPDASETWYDGVDDDCDGNDNDQDVDGYSVDDDCDDTDASIFPGAEGLDDDCNEVDASVDGLGADSGLVGNSLDGATGGGGMGCSSSKTAMAFGFLALLAPLMRRRRRED